MLLNVLQNFQALPMVVCKPFEMKKDSTLFRKTLLVTKATMDRDFTFRKAVNHQDYRVAELKTKQDQNDMFLFKTESVAEVKESDVEGVSDPLCEPTNPSATTRFANSPWLSRVNLRSHKGKCKLLASLCEDPHYYCLIAVKNVKPDEEKIVGSLEMAMGINAEEELFGKINFKKMRRIYVPSDAFMTELLVADEARCRGIGSGLLSLATCMALSSDMKKMYVDVPVDNKAAIEFFKKRGYQVVSNHGWYMIMSAGAESEFVPRGTKIKRSQGGRKWYPRSRFK